MQPTIVCLCQNPKRIEYRAHTIFVRVGACEILKLIAWYADVEPPEADGIYRGSSWLEKELAIDAATTFIDALIVNAFPSGWQPIKEKYAKNL